MSHLLETSIVDNISHIYAGDFNLYHNNVDSQEMCTFNEPLECLDCTNHVDSATHDPGNTLDIVISDDSDIIQHVDQGCQFSDHLAVNLELRIPRPHYNKIETSSWKINDIDTKLISDEIKSKLDGIQYNSLSEHMHLYNDTLKYMLDKYTPIKVHAKPANHINPGTTKT